MHLHIVQYDAVYFLIRLFPYAIQNALLALQSFVKWKALVPQNLAIQ
jgi:hypothetical protein